MYALLPSPPSSPTHKCTRSDASSDIDLLLSQDIDSAIEKFACSPTCGAVGGPGCRVEEFSVENIHPWDATIEPGRWR